MTAAAPERARPAGTVVRLETGPDALALLDDRWDALLRRVPLPNPLLSTTALRALALWRTGLPLVAVAEEGGHVVAGAALELRRRGRVGPLVATWLGPPELQCSSDLLVDPERPQAGDAVLAAVLEEADALSILAPASGAAARAAGTVAPWRGTASFADRWLLALPPPRLEYVRREAAADRRRAARLGAAVEVRVVSEPDEVAAALTRLFRIHRDRWRDRPYAEAQLATTRALRLWNMAVLTELAAGGYVLVAEVVEDGRTVSSAVGLRHGTGGLALVTALRPGGVLRQPGHLAALTRAEALVEAGVTAIDLGWGADGPGGPKRRLGPEPDPLVALFIARSPARQRFYDTLRRARDTARAG